MQRQDMNGVRTPQDIERKYDLGSIGQLKQNFELQKEVLTKVENENNNILKSIIINLEGILESQSEISLWFFSGIPTLENSPYIDWENPNEHIGDIYYDKETGNTYIFKTIDGEYLWELSTSSELMRAMALSNAQVSIGNERKVFFSEPITPYQNGDWYLKDNDLYICQVTRSETEKYNENDFIIAVKYTDDSYAIGIGENLTILSGTVTEIKKDVDELETTMTNTTELVNEQGEKVGTLEVKTSQTEQTVDSISESVSSLSDNFEQKQAETELTLENYSIRFETIEGKITNMNYDFSTDYLKIAKSDDPISAQLYNRGIKIYNYDTLTSIFSEKGSGFKNLIVTETAQLGYLKFMKSTKNGKPITAIHHVISEIQTLEDLESDT